MQQWNVLFTVESVSVTHCVADWRGEDAEQAGDAAPDAGEHSLTLHQGSVLQLSRRICTRSQQSILHRRQDEASTLTEEGKSSAGLEVLAAQASSQIGFTYPDSNHKVAEISQVHVCLRVVALLGQAGPPASRSLCRHRQDGDGLNAGRLQRRGGRQGHEVGRVVVLTAGQLQLLTHRQLQENTRAVGMLL